MAGLQNFGSGFSTGLMNAVNRYTGYGNQGTAPAGFAGQFGDTLSSVLANTVANRHAILPAFGALIRQSQSPAPTFGGELAGGLKGEKGGQGLLTSLIGGLVGRSGSLFSSAAPAAASSLGSGAATEAATAAASTAGGATGAVEGGSSLLALL